MRKVRNHWIEVTMGDWAWTEKLVASSGIEGRGLKAPNDTKHLNLLRKIKPDDVIITYLAYGLTVSKKWKGAMVGISTVNGNLDILGKTLVVPLIRSVEFVTPIRFSEFKRYKEGYSIDFQKGIQMSMQCYIVGITESDTVSLLSIHPENFGELDKMQYFDWSTIRTY